MTTVIWVETYLFITIEAFVCTYSLDSHLKASRKKKKDYSLEFKIL